jgi:peptide/nickel transport system substrate-binding protein
LVSVAWEEGTQVVLKKTIITWEGFKWWWLPYLDGIKVNFYDSKATEFWISAGDWFYINDIDPSFKDEIFFQKTGNLKKPNGKLNCKASINLNIEFY